MPVRVGDTGGVGFVLSLPMVTVGQEEIEKGVEIEDANGDQGAEQMYKDAQEGHM